MEDKKVRKKLARRVHGGFIDTQAQKRLCREHGFRVSPTLHVADKPETISAHEFRNFLLSVFSEAPAPSVLRLSNSAAVRRVLVILAKGIHPSALASAETLEKFTALRRFGPLKPVRSFEGERPSPLVEALLYTKRDRGSTQSVRKRRKVISKSEDKSPMKMELPPLEHYVATQDQLVFQGFQFAKLAEPDGSAGSQFLKDFAGPEAGDAREAMIRESETDSLSLLLPETDAQRLLEGLGEVEGYCFVSGEPETGREPRRRTFAMDCEMVETAAGFELARLSIVELMGEAPVQPPQETASPSRKRPRPQDGGLETSAVLDVFVLPRNPVLNYLTKYSGITKEILDGTRVTFAQARAAVLRLLRRQDVLVGHSLENDLKCLRIAHRRIVDTSILYAHPQGPPRRASLKWLAKTYLDRQIHADEQAGHDSVEDARTALALALLKVESGPHFGLNSATFNKQSIAQLISCQSLQQKDPGEEEDEPRSRAVWVSHVASLGFHARPGVQGVSFQDFRTSHISSAFEKAVQSAGEGEALNFRDLVVLPVDARQLEEANSAAQSESQPPPESSEPGINETKVAALLGQGLAESSLEALDALLDALHQSLRSSEPRHHDDDRTLVLLLTQVDIKPILAALKQKQACSSVKSASIWSPRQQKLLRTMSDAARDAAFSYAFW